MSFAAGAHSTVEPTVSAGADTHDFVSVIRDLMSDRNISQRSLAPIVGISKTRLGLLLHSDASKRSGMTLDELQRILAGLKVSLLHAVILAEGGGDRKLIHDDRFTSALAMLVDLFAGLPDMLAAALDEIEGIDGTEVRKEWAGPLRKAVVERLVKEVTAVMARRDQLAHSAALGL